MMGPANGMAGFPFHMVLAVVALLALVALVAVIAARLASRPQTSPRFPMLSAMPFSVNQGNSPSSTRDERVERYMFVVPDISGYTGLVQPNRLAISYAHHIVRSLIDAIMTAFIPPFSAARIEGDAVVFHAASEAAEADNRAFSDAVARGFAAFDRRLQTLIAKNACPCAACDRLAGLDLKIVIHCGDAIRYRIGPLEDFTGEPLVVVHQLLKNKLGKKRYVLVTESAAEIWPSPLGTPSESHDLDEHAPGVGLCRVFEGPPKPEGIAPEAGLSAKIADIGRKVAVSARAGLGRA